MERSEPLPESPSEFIALLEAESARLQLAVQHLERSNAELKEFIQTQGGPDADMKQAIEENIPIIAKNKARIERLGKEAAELRRGVQAMDAELTIPAAEQQQQPPPPPPQQQQQQPGAAAAAAVGQPAAAAGDPRQEDSGLWL